MLILVGGLINMFGKNYDVEIKELKDIISKMQEQQGKILDIITAIENRPNNVDELIRIARIQATHKKCIYFLLKHIDIDADEGGAELLLLLKDIADLNR